MESLGELVKAWRTASGLTQADLAARVGGKVKYQNIQQLEAGSAKLPRYIAALAMAMRTTVEDLVALKMPPPLGEDVYLPSNHDRESRSNEPLPGDAQVAAAIRFLAETVAERDEATREAAAAAIAAVIRRPDRVAQFTKALQAILEEHSAPEQSAPQQDKARSDAPVRKRTGTGE